MTRQAPTFFFDEPRLKLTLPGRFLVRVGGMLGWLGFLLGAALALGSETIWLRWVGIFIGLVVADRVLHHGESDVPLGELLKKSSINLAAALDPKTEILLEHAFERGLVTGTDPSLEFLRSLLSRRDIKEGLTRLEVDFAEFREKTEELLGRADAKSALGKEDRIRAYGALLEQAFWIAAARGALAIAPRDAFAAVASVSDGPAAKVFTMFNITPGDLSRALLFAEMREHRSLLGRLPGTLRQFVLPAHRTRRRVVNRAWTSRATPTLDRYGKDVSSMASRGEIGFLIGHAREYQELVAVLSRPMSPNALLVGEEGIGKEVVIAHLAFAIEKDDVPRELFDRRLVSLDLSLLTAGADAPEVEARLVRVAREIMEAGNIILFIPDAHVLAEQPALLNGLLPILRDNAFPVIAMTYPKEYKKSFEGSALHGLFETVMVQEIAPEDAERVLVYHSLLLEAEHRTTITFGAVKMAVRLAKKYFRRTYLPGSAVELLTNAVARAVAAGEKKVDHAAVVRAAEAQVNVPLHEADAEERAKLLALEDTLHRRVVGQDEAVRAVSEALREYRAGLVKTNGPIASFLFVGPSGVGKTELAKTLAAAEFGSEKALIRLDMSEYKEGSSGERLAAFLADAVKATPYALLLLDEFEKASKEVLDLFLQVLDDGRLTDNEGTTADFTNTIIIATSNAHSDLLHDALAKGESVTAIAEYLKQRLTDVFRAELLNRFSKVVVFRELPISHVKKIAEIELGKLGESVVPQGFTLKFAESVAEEIAKSGYEPQEGARHLKRVIEEKLRAPLAEFLLKENPPRGAVIEVIRQEDTFSFRARS